jgi:uncharacterized protein (TIGR00730 family)
MKKTICVYCSSSSEVDEVYFDAAEQLGRKICNRDWRLIYGAGKIGLMGTLAQAVISSNCYVTGVIPDFMKDSEVHYDECHELIWTADMRARKAIMEERADAFIALPGGFGTLEELMEVLTLKQLKRHSKPIVILNTNGFYTELLAMFDRMFMEQFAKQSYKSIYHITENIDNALDYIESYKPEKSESKWF